MICMCTRRMLNLVLEVIIVTFFASVTDESLGMFMYAQNLRVGMAWLLLNLRTVFIQFSISGG